MCVRGGGGGGYLNSNEERDMLQEKLKGLGIPTMVYYPTALHKQPVYKEYNYNLEDLKVSENLSECVLSIPMHPYLTEEQVNHISNSVINTLNEIR